MGDMEPNWAYIKSQLMEDFVYVGDVWRNIASGEDFEVVNMRTGPGQPLAWQLCKIGALGPGQVVYEVEHSLFTSLFSLIERIEA